MQIAEVVLWDRRIGALAWEEGRRIGSFEYDPEFIGAGIEPAPITMPVSRAIHRFPELDYATFKGLPGVVADSLPDRFGNAVLDVWLARKGRTRASMTPVEQLLYIGARGMGALEYHPPSEPPEDGSEIDLDGLADLAADVLSQRAELSTRLDSEGLGQLFRVGTSAGGARAKALINWNESTGEVRTGQVEPPEGFEPWLLKFDGVGSQDRDLGDQDGFGTVEYAYHQMATDAGVVMTECRLIADASQRTHFMTRRFDRTRSGDRIHVATLCGIAHYDFNQPGRYGYEDALAVGRQLNIPHGDTEQLVRRMMFNVVGRNQDDHTKNISFAMNRSGEWRLTPAYDVIWAYNPSGPWTSRHQMTINGKRDGFEREDLLAVANQAGVADAAGLLDRVIAVVERWSEYAQAAGVGPDLTSQIGSSHRLAWDD